MIYELFVCIAATGWGCCHQMVTQFPEPNSKQLCLEALQSMRVENHAVLKGNDPKGPVVALCRPATPKKSK